MEITVNTEKWSLFEKAYNEYRPISNLFVGPFKIHKEMQQYIELQFYNQNQKYQPPNFQKK